MGPPARLQALSAASWAAWRACADGPARAQALFDAQLGSIKGLQAAWHSDCDKRPHTLATRYAALAASLLLLNANYQASCRPGS